MVLSLLQNIHFMISKISGTDHLIQPLDSHSFYSQSKQYHFYDFYYLKLRPSGNGFVIKTCYFRQRSP